MGPDPSPSVTQRGGESSGDQNSPPVKSLATGPPPLHSPRSGASMGTLNGHSEALQHLVHRAWRSGSTTDRRQGNFGQERGGQGVEKVRKGKVIATHEKHKAKQGWRRSDHASRKLTGVQACSGERLRSLRCLPHQLSMHNEWRRRRGSERCSRLRVWVAGLVGVELLRLGGDGGRRCGLLLLRARERAIEDEWRK